MSDLDENWAALGARGGVETANDDAPDPPTSRSLNFRALTNAQLGIEDPPPRRSVRMPAPRAPAIDDMDIPVEDDERGGGKKKGQKELADEYEAENYEMVSLREIAGLPASELEEWWSSCDEFSDDDLLYENILVEKTRDKSRKEKETTEKSSAMEATLTRDEDLFGPSDLVGLSDEEEEEEENERETACGRKRKQADRDSETRHSVLKCFFCNWGNRDIDASKKNVLDKVLTEFENSIGREGISYLSACRRAHVNFKNAVFLPMRKNGIKVQMMSTRRFYAHFRKSKEPRLWLNRVEEDSAVFDLALKRMSAKRRKDNPQMVRFDPKAFQALQANLKWQKELYQIGSAIKKMNHYNENMHYGAGGSIVNQRLRVDPKR